MIREVDLVSYLPLFMRKYKEPAAALEAENPEFAILWKAADTIMRNRFISTADEDGIARFEKLMGIMPSESDTLEIRRIRLQNRWCNVVPHTMRVLRAKLSELLGGEHCFSIFPDFDSSYGMLVVVYSVDDGLHDELRYLLDTIVPMNVTADIVYENVTSSLSVHCGGVMEQADILEIRQR